MCQHLTVLVKSSDQRYIAQCEHGTVHLVWHHAVLQVRAGDFVRLANFLNTWTAYGAESACDAVFRLHQSDSGAAQLWIGGIGLYLTPFDLLALNDMAQAATTQLTASAAPVSNCAGWESQQYQAYQSQPHMKRCVN